MFLQSLDDVPVDTNDFDIKDFINNFSSANSPTLTIEQSTTSSAVRPTSKETTTPLSTSSTTSQTTTTTTTTPIPTTVTTSTSTESTTITAVSSPPDSLSREETKLPTTSLLASTILRPEANSNPTTFSNEVEGVKSVEQGQGSAERPASVLDYNHFSYVNIVPVYPLLYYMSQRPSYYGWQYIVPVPVHYHQYNNMIP